MYNTGKMLLMFLRVGAVLGSSVLFEAGRSVDRFSTPETGKTLF